MDILRPITGTLKEPLVHRFSDGMQISYHWEGPGDKQTFLYLTIRKDPKKNIGVAQSNFDSEDVKGQGDSLWIFLKKRIQEFSNKGIGDNKSMQIIHKVDTNEYSRRLPESDPQYTQSEKDDNVFYCIFSPEK